MRPVLPRLALVALALTLVGCPPVRGGGGDDDDNASAGEHGVFLWQAYGYDYAIGQVLVTRDDEDTCGIVDGGYIAEDGDYDYARAIIYRGNDVGWVGEFFSTYDQDGPCYDIEGDLNEIRCLGGAIDCRGEDDCTDSYEATFRITSFSDSTVAGTITIGGRETPLSVLNCV